MMNIGGQSLKFEDGQWITGKTFLPINKHMKVSCALLFYLLL